VHNGNQIETVVAAVLGGDVCEDRLARLPLSTVASQRKRRHVHSRKQKKPGEK
jgi:hypothetical protein